MLKIKRKKHIGTYAIAPPTPHISGGKTSCPTPQVWGEKPFEQTDYDTIYNIPLQVGWQGKVGRVDLQAAAGVDIFNRLPMAVNLNLQASAPIFLNSSSKGGLESALFLTGVLEQGPYKFNAQTLENQITAWRFGPNVYWQDGRHSGKLAL